MAISQGIHGPVLGPLASLVMNGVLIGICMALLFHKNGDEMMVFCRYFQW